TIYLLQGALALVIAAPILVGGFSSGPVTVVAWLGLAVWAVGVFFAAVGDAQMERWRADPSHKGKVIDVGLWRYTRHPNYFGDACVWWGIFLVAVGGTRWSLLTVLSPAVMTYFLVFATGAKLLERSMMKRDGYPEYAAR